MNLACVLTVVTLQSLGPCALAQKLDTELSNPPPMSETPAASAVVTDASAPPSTAEPASVPVPDPVAPELLADMTVPAVVVAEQFHDLLRQGQRDLVLKLLAPDVTIFESGYGEASRDGYADNGHLDDDIRFAAGTVRVVLQRRIIRADADDLTAVMVIAQISGQYENQPVNLVQSETMLLRHTEEGWRIVHIHWSGHPGKS